MPAHDSRYPDEIRAKSFRFDVTGVSANWKVFIALITIVIGGAGGYTGLRLISYTEAREMLTEVEEKGNRKNAQLETKVEGNTKKINKVKVTLVDVQTVQHMDIAVREARRVTQDIKCRSNNRGCELEKLKTLERVRQRNMKRLKAKLEPCSTVDCTN